jgi:uncharacterized protein
MFHSKNGGKGKEKALLCIVSHLSLFSFNSFTDISCVSLSVHVHATLYLKYDQSTDLISTFTFELSHEVSVLPGGYVVLDFSDTFAHLQLDNYVRTWTVSSATPCSPNTAKKERRKAASHMEEEGQEGQETFSFDKSKLVEVTVKHKKGGSISSLLHSYHHIDGRKPKPTMVARLIGVGGSFSCFESLQEKNSSGEHVSPTSSGSGGGGVPGLLLHLPPKMHKMLWVAGGVGITPFMSMWHALVQRFLRRDSFSSNSGLSSNRRPGSGECVDIVLYYACRGVQEWGLMKQFINKEKVALLKQHNLQPRAESLRISHMVIFDSTFDQSSSSLPLDLNIKGRRIASDDYLAIEDLKEREVFLCGPFDMIHTAEVELQAAGVATSQIHHESFLF